MKRVLLVAALLAPALAGCLAQEAPAAVDPLAAASPVLFDELLAEHLPHAADDGVLLDAWVFRPDTAEPVPVIVNFSPYWSNLSPPASEKGDAFSQYLVDYFVPRGYAVALVSARGTGLSEGCFGIGGPRELKDLDLTTTFLAEQPWSNGNVAAVAKSYDGTMAQGLLTTGNPHVKTIVPVSPISEFYKYNYAGGVPYAIGGLLFNTYYVLLTSLTQNVDPFSAAANGDVSTYERTPTRLCDEAAHVQAAQYHGALTGEYSAYWQARNYTALLPDTVDASVFYVHGLQDWNVKTDHMVPWIDALHERDVTVKMWLGQWEHDYPTRDDFNATLLRWLDHELKGLPTGIMDEPLVQVQDTEGVWRHEARWPPARARTLALHPDAGGALAPAPGTGESSWLDSRAPLPGLANVAVFESEPLSEPLRLAGAPAFHARVSSTAPRATLSVTLMADDVVVDQGFLDLLHRGDLATSEPMTPGEWYDVTVHFYPQDTVLPAGARLRLLVGHVPPEDAPVPVAPFSGGGVVTLDHAASVLAVPVLDYADVTPEARQPEDVGCWAC